jgi:hypothetical protein
VVGHMHQIKQMECQQQHRWIFTVVNIVLLLLAFHFVLKLFPIESRKPVSYSDFLVTERELIGVRKDDSSHPNCGWRTYDHCHAAARCR